jgi:hypothetical protein
VEADGARVGRVVDLVDDGAEHRLRVRLGTPAPDPGRTPAPGEEALEASRG